MPTLPAQDDKRNFAKLSVQVSYALCFASSVVKKFQSTNDMKDDSNINSPTFLQRERGGYCRKKESKQNSNASKDYIKMLHNFDVSKNLSFCKQHTRNFNKMKY